MFAARLRNDRRGYSGWWWVESELCSRQPLFHLQMNFGWKAEFKTFPRWWKCSQRHCDQAAGPSLTSSHRDDDASQFCLSSTPGLILQIFGEWSSNLNSDVWRLRQNPLNNSGFAYSGLIIFIISLWGKKMGGTGRLLWALSVCLIFFQSCLRHSKWGEQGPYMPCQCNRRTCSTWLACTLPLKKCSRHLAFLQSSATRRH